MTQTTKEVVVMAVYYQITVRLRICDFGGWLDTWFAEFGRVMNLAVLSKLFGQTSEFRGIDLMFCLRPKAADSRGNLGSVTLNAADPKFDRKLSRRRIRSASKACRENLLLAVLSLCELEKLPDGDLEFLISSPIPPGASMGTSAAVAVALIKAVNFLRKQQGLSRWSNKAIATMAFRAETEVMGGQSGTQDQWSAVFDWWIKLITVCRYPETRAERVGADAKFKDALRRGLITVVVGQHNSSETHLEVIAAREQEGAASGALQKLRDVVGDALAAVTAGDINAFGGAMTANTNAQREMHKGLVGSRHQAVIELATTMLVPCLGYKVNGAGGEGGSATFLFPSREAAESFYDRAVEVHPEFLYFEHKL